MKFQYQFGLSLSSWGMLAELIFVYFNHTGEVEPKSQRALKAAECFYALMKRNCEQDVVQGGT